VLQRDKPIHLWGWADPEEQVSATLNSSKQSTVADKLGVWSLYLPPQPAGGPVQIHLSGTNQITLEDVLIGDVWVASGQSNMEMPLKGFPGSAVIKNGAEEISRAKQPSIRLLLVDRKASAVPLTDFASGSGWKECTPETAADFSAVAYFFGQKIAAEEHVPVGLIDSSWGGTPAEAWISLEGIAADASLMPVFAARAEMMQEQAGLPAILAAEARADALAAAKNLPRPEHRWRPDPDSWDPAWLYNGMISPLVNLPIRGAIWYQGESNTSGNRAFLYERVFRTLIGDWRAHWKQGDFPFFFVQIANFDSSAKDNWPLVREAQRRTLALRKTGMAVTIDIGDPKNIHPADKRPVGERLALAARAVEYGEKVEFSGPSFRQINAEPDGLRVWFDHAEGMSARGGEPGGFEIAGADRHFVRASAHMDGSSIVVSSPQVQNPLYVRYGWENAPVLNLYNAAGLPASPFTSEDPIPLP